MEPRQPCLCCQTTSVRTHFVRDVVQAPEDDADERRVTEAAAPGAAACTLAAGATALSAHDHDHATSRTA